MKFSVIIALKHQKRHFETPAEKRYFLKRLKKDVKKLHFSIFFHIYYSDGIKKFLYGLAMSIIKIINIKHHEKLIIN